MNIKKIWNIFDELCYKLSYYIIIAVIIIVLGYLYFSSPYVQGEYMMYEDYYNQHK